MKPEIQRLIELMLPQQVHFDALAVGVIDFKKQSFTTCGHTDTYFDLASVTKVLGMASVYALHPKEFSPEMRLLIEHRAGLPAWGLLPNPGWKEIINSYHPKEAATLYSDYSAIRANLEIENKFKKTTPEILKKIWDKEVCFWRNLPGDAACVATGERNNHVIQGDVHDPNAWVIKEWCGHAGLFGTVAGVCRTLLKLEEESKFINLVKTGMANHPHRFIFGWDRVENPQETLAGVGCSTQTFGHLGFTGTSVWIDAEKMMGHVILSNATRDGWYRKDGLNELRRAIGSLVWSG